MQMASCSFVLPVSGQEWQVCFNAFLSFKRQFKRQKITLAQDVCQGVSPLACLKKVGHTSCVSYNFTISHFSVCWNPQPHSISPTSSTSKGVSKAPGKKNKKHALHSDHCHDVLTCVERSLLSLCTSLPRAARSPAAISA